MNTHFQSITEFVEEAEFQVLATIDVCNWVAAIARAIARDVKSGAGADVTVLTDLAKYFDDVGASSLDAAFEQFRKIAQACLAPQNAQSENVARESGVPGHES